MNKEKENKDVLYRIILIPIYIMVVSAILFVTLVTVFKPQENLLVRQTVLFGIVVVSANVLLYFLWSKYVKNHKFFNIVLIFFAIAWIALIVYASVKNTDRRDTLYDYFVMFANAESLAKGNGFTDTDYLKIFTNNIKPTLFLSVIFKTGYLFHIKENFFALGVSVIQLLVTMISIRELTCDKENGKWTLFSLLLAATCLPIYAFSGVFYTDTFSFGLGIIALACIKKSLKSKTVLRIILLALAGFLTVYGMQWKITSIFPLIAAMIVFLAGKTRENIKENAISIMIILGVCILTLFSFKIWGNSYGISSKGTENPLISWIAIGMRENGSWLENSEYITEVNAMASTQEKTEHTVQYIKENWRDAFTINHIVRKAQYNFAGGMFRTQIYLYPWDTGTLIWAMMNPWGKYHWRASQFTFCWIISVYGMFLLGSVLSLYNLIRGKKLPTVKMIADISMLGIIIFLMIWEANSRQLYNQVPVMIVGSIANGRYIASQIEDLISKRKARVHDRGES